MSGTPPGYTLDEVRCSLKDLRTSHESGHMAHVPTTSRSGS